MRRLAQRDLTPAPAHAAEADEHCELCGLPVPDEHRHVVDLQTRRLLCACRACSVLFDRRAAGGGHYRLVPDRRLRLPDFTLSEETWARLQIPVDMAFFFANSSTEQVMAFYPGPMGATESRLDLEDWQGVEAANPVLQSMEVDVEALLVDRAKGARRYYLVPVDDCYRLVALIRMRWRGFTGGREVWAEIDDFFADLDRRARTFNPEPAPERS
ncbi:MAG: DUF5947 family protein [Actinobacteria bacterium]|nr:DUF5947 family protein [Actinomycetota bacterium]